MNRPRFGYPWAMKFKRLPEDFRVEELPLIQGGDRGRFAFYRLWKRGIGSLEALDSVRRRWNIPANRVHYGGLKDRHAETVQYLTILEGPDRSIREPNLELEPLGLVSQPYGPAFFRGNRFRLVLRDMGDEAAARAVRALASIDRDGVPNYFDDQRFGSVGFAGGFIAEAWLKGDHETALKLAIVEPTISDRPETREEKAILTEFWGRWAEAKARLPKSHARSLVTYLADHPTDFRGAFARLRRDLRSIYFSAYQSFLWNMALGRLIDAKTRPDQRVAVNFKVATLPIHHDLDPAQADELGRSTLPLPTTRTHLPESGEVRDLMLGVVAERGLVWNDLRVKHLKDVFFSKGERRAVFHPSGTTCEVADDDLYPRRKKVSLGFDLPKGCYATLIVKRCTKLADPAASLEEDDDPDPV
jgi:tRNA pseudouridine13 synthase